MKCKFCHKELKPILTFESKKGKKTFHINKTYCNRVCMGQQLKLDYKNDLCKIKDWNG